MSNSNWEDTNLPRPPVPAPAARPQTRTRDEIVQDLAHEVLVESFHRELEFADYCPACRAWLFGDGLQCELHNYEG